MRTKRFKPWYKLLAIALSACILAAPVVDSRAFAIGETDTEPLYGQELLDELRGMGLGVLQTEDVPAVSEPETAEPGDTKPEEPDASKPESTEPSEEGEPEVSEPAPVEPSEEVSEPSEESEADAEVTPVAVTEGFSAPISREPAASPSEKPAEEPSEPSSEPSIDPVTPPETSTPEVSEPEGSEESSEPTEEIIPDPVPEAKPETSEREKLTLYVQALEIRQLETLDTTDITEVEAEDLISLLTQEQIAAWQEFSLSDSGGLSGAVNFTDVGPFVGPVSGNGALRSAMNTQVNSLADNGLFLDKKSTWNTASKNATIRLEAYTNGVVTSTEKSIPTDIVLVLDQSGSMTKDFISSRYFIEKNYSKNKDAYSDRASLYVKVSEDYYKVSISRSGIFTYTFTYTYRDKSGKTYTESSDYNDGDPPKWNFCYETVETKSRVDALKDTVNTFVNQITEDATLNDVNHRVAIVGFADNGNKYTNTEILTVTGNSAINYGKAQAADYKNALMDVKKNQEKLKKAINWLDADGNTYSEYGLDMAAKILTNNPIPSGEQRNRVVIMFTDGYTAPSGTDSILPSMSNNAIAKASSIKQMSGATVYSVGIFDTADPTMDISGSYSYNGNYIHSKDEVRIANRYMHYVSSNYPDAVSLDKSGSRSDEGNYYLSAGDTDALEEIFTKIKDQIQTPSISLDGKTELRDVVSNYFKSPNDVSKIRLYTAKYLGNGQFGEPVAAPSTVKAKISGSTVSVTGFDYNSEFVADTPAPKGSKLIVEFEASPIDGFIGGNLVATNEASSGIYRGGDHPSLVSRFPEPTVNIPLQYDFTATDMSLYLTDGAIASDLAARFGSTWNINGVTNAFADITYTLKQGLTEIGQYVIPHGKAAGAWSPNKTPATQSPNTCTDYTVTCDVTPAFGTTNGVTKWSQNKSFKIHVFTPTIACNDSEIYLGEQANFTNSVSSTVNWACKDANAAAPQKTKPTLSYSFIAKGDRNPLSDLYLEKETDFNVKTAIGSRDVTGYTTVKAANGATDHHFTIKVKTCTLTITKSFKNGASASGVGTENFLFKINRADNDKFSKFVPENVVITGANSVTITGLPIGAYTVTEDGNWSWRYKDNQNGSANLSAANPNGSVSIVNELTKTGWLSWEDIKSNLFQALGVH